MVEYRLTGHGADKQPYNLFVINPENGYVTVTGLLDREKTSLYNVSFVPCFAVKDIKTTVDLINCQDTFFF